jgi:hypothetical protein
MITERQREAYAKLLGQLGEIASTDTDAVLDALYTLATCAIEYKDYKDNEKSKRLLYQENP